MKKQMLGKQKIGKIEYTFAEICVRMVCAFLCVELLFQGLIYLLSSEFAGWYVTMHGYVMLQILIIFSILLFEIILPLCGKYKKFIVIAMEIAYPFAVLWYVWKHFIKLTESGMVLANDYLKYWNKQFETNYVGFESAEAAPADALIFLIGAAFFLFFLLCYITGIRLFLIVPHLTVFFGGLLVNAVPGWMALAFVFVGTIMLYAMPWEKSRVVWKKRREKSVSAKTLFGQLFLYFATAFIAVIMVSLTGYAFSGIADRIPEKTPQFYAFQEKLEEKVKSLGSLGIPFSKEKAYVDNSTPEYSGDEVLTISADYIPTANLYLKNFQSGTYRNHEWVGDKKEFKKAAKQTGYDPDHIAVMIQQQLYESILKTAFISDIFPDEWETNYQITYKQNYSSDALLPYFSNITDTGHIWMDGDNPVRKKRFAKSLSAKGVRVISGLNERLGNLPVELVEQGDHADEIAWYGKYASENYRNSTSQVPAVKQYADRIIQSESGGIEWLEDSSYADQWIQMQVGTWGSEDYSKEITNWTRYMIAEDVAAKLAEGFSYNIYLNPVPEGEDTIQYFLETSHEGYCMHYASAGTLILQELGVPARYASGYVVKPGMFQKDGNGEVTAKVPDYNAHAWAEIYLEDIGWVPVEMTPGYDGTSGVPANPENKERLKNKHEDRQQKKEQEETGTQTGSESETETETESETQKETESQHPSETETVKDENNWNGAGNSGTAVYKIDKRIMVLIFAILLVIGAVIFFMRQLRCYKEILLTEIRRRQNRRAVRRMNRRIYAKLRRHTFGIKTDEQYLEKLIASYPDISPEDWKQYIIIVQKAAFSREKISPEEVHFCYRIYHRCRKLSRS